MAEIDKKIINILINNKKELNDFISVAGEGIFDSKYRRFIKNLILYHKTYESCPTLTTFLAFIGRNENLKTYIEEIWNSVDALNIDSREYSFLLEQAKSRYNKNIFSVIKEKFSERIDDVEEGNNFLFKVVSEIQGIGKKSIYNEVILRDSVNNWLASFKAKAQNQEVAQGVLTGFKTIDYYTNGMKPGELMLFAADSGCGKSIFLVNLATNCFLGKNKLPESKQEAKEKLDWKKSNNVLYISLEMNEEEVQNRILSCMSDVNSLDLDKGIVGPEEAARLKKALAYWEHGPGDIKIVDVARGCKMSDIQEIYENCCLSFKPDLVVVDYLGLMVDNLEDSNADWEKLKNVAEQMHEFARYNKVPVATAVQLKTTKPGDGGIGLHKIGRSSMIAHNANIVLQLEYREDEESRVDGRIHCIKFRRGPKFVMNNVRKEFQHTKFIDMGNAESADKKVLSNDDLTGAMALLLGE